MCGIALFCLGMTTVIGLLNELFPTPPSGDEGGAAKLPASKRTHRVRSVRLVWVVRLAAHASWFIDQLEECLAVAASDPRFPALYIQIYITRGDPGAANASLDDVAARVGRGARSALKVAHGRPDLQTTLAQGVGDTATHPGKLYVLGCGPHGLVRQLWDDVDRARKTADISLDRQAYGL